MNKCWVFMSIVGFIFSCSNLCLSQEDILGDILQEQEEKSESMKYAYGRVAAIDKTANKITTKERDWDSDREVNVTYLIHPEIELENIASWEEIPVGSEVDIAYLVDEKGQRIASFIKLYEETEEEMPVEGY